MGDLLSLQHGKLLTLRPPAHRSLFSYTTMASEFIGCTVLVTLKTPPNCRVEGEVVDVVGTRLSLQNGWSLLGFTV